MEYKSDFTNQMLTNAQKVSINAILQFQSVTTNKNHMNAFAILDILEDIQSTFVKVILFYICFKFI